MSYFVKDKNILFRLQRPKPNVSVGLTADCDVIYVRKSDAVPEGTREATRVEQKAIEAYVRNGLYGVEKKAPRKTFKMIHIREADMGYPARVRDEVCRLVRTGKKADYAIKAAKLFIEKETENLKGGDPYQVTTWTEECASESIASAVLEWTHEAEGFMVVHFDLNKEEWLKAMKPSWEEKNDSSFERKSFKALERAIRHYWRTDVALRGISLEGEKYILLTASPGQQRKDCCYAIEEKTFFSHCEQLAIPGGTSAAFRRLVKNNRKVLLAKYCQYLALNLSTGIPSGRTVLGKIRLKEIVCVQANRFPVTLQNVAEVTTDGDVVKHQKLNIKTYLGDGSVLFIKENLPDEAAGYCAQIRSTFGLKGCGAVVPVITYLQKKNYKQKIIDVDGVETPLTGIKAIITPDVWKTSVFFDSWRQFVRLCEENKIDEVFIGNDNTESKFGLVKLSNQMLGSLWDARPAELEKLAEISIAQTKELGDLQGAYYALAEGSKPWAAKSNTAKMIAVAPAMLNTCWAKAKLQEKHSRAYFRLKSGQVKVPGFNGFVQPDWTALCDVWFGGIKPEDAGVLHAYEVCCNVRGVKPGEAILLRSPHASTDEHVKVRVVNNSWLDAAPNVVFVSCHDAALFRLGGADCDGDHVYLTQFEPLLSCVTRIQTESRFPTPYWKGGEAEKVVPSTNKQLYFKGIASVMDYAFEYNWIGILAAGLRTKWSQINYKGMTEEELTDICKRAAGASFAVDAVKTGSVPEFVREYAEESAPPNDWVRYRHAKPLRKKKLERLNASLIEDNYDSAGVIPADDYKTTFGWCSIDKLGAVADKQISEWWSCPAIDEMDFKWGSLQRREDILNGGSFKGQLDVSVWNAVAHASTVKADAKAPKGTLANLLSQNGAAIGVADAFRLLTYAKAANHNNAAKEGGEEFCAAEYAEASDADIEWVRDVLAQFALDNCAALKNATKEIALRYVSNVLLRTQVDRFMKAATAWQEAHPGTKYAEVNLAEVFFEVEENTYSNEQCDYKDFALDSLFMYFGDLYAEACLLNEREGFKPRGRYQLVRRADGETVQAPPEAYLPPEPEYGYYIDPEIREQANCYELTDDAFEIGDPTGYEDLDVPDDFNNYE